MNNVRREEIENKTAAVSSTAANAGQVEGEGKESVMARLLLLRELAQILPERMSSLLAEEGEVEGEGESSSIKKPVREEEEEEDEESLRTALSKMILSIEESTVKLAEFHSIRTDNSVVMSQATLDDIDRTWDDMMDNFAEIDKMMDKLKEMAGWMKALTVTVMAASAMIAALTLGAMAAVVVVVMSVAQPFIDKAVDDFAKALEVIGVPKDWSRFVANLTITGATMVMSMGASVAAKGSKIAATVANRAVDVVATAYMATGGLLTPMVVAIMKDQGCSEDSIDYVEMSLGMLEMIGCGYVAFGAGVNKKLNKVQGALLGIALMMGLGGSLGQAGVQGAEATTKLALADAVKDRGDIEAEMQMLQFASRMNDETMKGQTSHQRGLTQGREAMTQSYGAMMGGAWKAMSHIIK